jgi:hypothetical protein
VKTKHPKMPGEFEAMANWKSSAIQSWLDTTPANVARALFERGEKLEIANAELVTALKGMIAERIPFGQKKDGGMGLRYISKHLTPKAWMKRQKNAFAAARSVLSKAGEA